MNPERNYRLHNRVVKELMVDHSLAALKFLIESGRELEFTYREKEYFLTGDGMEETDGTDSRVYLYQDQKEMIFADMYEMILEARLEDGYFLDAWEDVEITVLF